MITTILRRDKNGSARYDGEGKYALVQLHDEIEQTDANGDVITRRPSTVTPIAMDHEVAGRLCAVLQHHAGAIGRASDVELIKRLGDRLSRPQRAKRVKPAVPAPITGEAGQHIIADDLNKAAKTAPPNPDI